MIFIQIIFKILSIQKCKFQKVQDFYLGIDLVYITKIKNKVKNMILN